MLGINDHVYHSLSLLLNAFVLSYAGAYLLTYLPT